MNSRSTATSLFRRYHPKINPHQPHSTKKPPPSEQYDQQTLEPSDLAQQEWQALGLPLPDLAVIRAYRLERIRQQLRRMDYAGIVLFDPINIRYATDTANMQVWCLHNAVRYCFIPTEGPVVLFEFYHCDHISHHLDLIDEIRPPFLLNLPVLVQFLLILAVIATVILPNAQLSAWLSCHVA
ncbi:hypothetical protein [Thioflexithrix psekupsensis]|uniref:Creatinase N-terminal domain-containing protein n=1 Tax=Thioflexithrix psekupsensis TaxID=1570016 RepID=A0A251X8X4_9GAMM|nr:hypothetical protein [Thioflexithrix psekupsensis]OUD14518.1 hypothetical protein TPSD3_09485 [Thioflexithrix psekupsensis]